MKALSDSYTALCERDTVMRFTFMSDKYLARFAEEGYPGAFKTYTGGQYLEMAEKPGVSESLKCIHDNGCYQLPINALFPMDDLPILIK